MAKLVLGVITTLFVLHVPSVCLAQDTSPEAIEQLFDRMGQEREYANRIRRLQNNSSIFALIGLMDSLQGMSNELELIDEQKSGLAGLKQEYEKKVAEIKGNPAQYRSDKEMQHYLAEAKYEYEKSIVETLLPHQLDVLANCDLLRAGLARTVTNFPMKDVLEVTDRQKEQIAKNAEEVAKKIEEFVHEARKEAYAAVMDELTDEQKEKLFEVYDEEEIIELMSHVGIEALYRQINLEQDLLEPANSEEGIHFTKIASEK